MIKCFQTTIRVAISPAILLAWDYPVQAVESLNSLKITEVVEKVDVTDSTSKRQRPAQVNGKFNVPDLLSTGSRSRAEMIAGDGTVTRIGSNTTFSFSPNKREINLEKGNVLFHSPVGKGGGVINAGGASAAVLGTTIIVSATTEGGFKMLVLEGTAKATLPGGKATSIEAGQLIYVLPGAKGFAPTTSFRLQSQVAGSALVQGFKEPLRSMGRIQEFTRAQEKKIGASMEKKEGGNRGSGPKEGTNGRNQPEQEGSGGGMGARSEGMMAILGGQGGGTIAGGGIPTMTQGTQNLLGPRTTPTMLPPSMQPPQPPQTRP